MYLGTCKLKWIIDSSFVIDRLKEGSRQSDRMTRSHKSVADTFIKISSGISAMGTSEYTNLDKFLNKTSEYFEKARKLEGRVASDEDLKLTDLLKYYLRDTEAAKDLLYRRARCLADYENTNKALDKARMKNKDVAAVSPVWSVLAWSVLVS